MHIHSSMQIWRGGGMGMGMHGTIVRDGGNVTEVEGVLVLATDKWPFAWDEWSVQPPASFGPNA